jgi:hypothetical protein
MARGTVAVYFFGDQRWIGCYLGLSQAPLHHGGEVDDEKAASAVGVWMLRYLALELLFWRMTTCAERCRSSLARFHECGLAAPFEAFASVPVAQGDSKAAEEPKEERLHALLVSQMAAMEEDGCDPLAAYLVSPAGADREESPASWRKRVLTAAGAEGMSEEWREMGKQTVYCSSQPLFEADMEGDAPQEVREAFLSNVLHARARLGWFLDTQACAFLRIPPPCADLTTIT